MSDGVPMDEPTLDRWRTWFRHRGLRELEDLLLVWWDPLGVHGEPDVRDEYAGYVPRLAGLLRAGAREADVAAHLRALEVDVIGAAGQADLAARHVVEWHDHALAALAGGRTAARDR